MKWKKNQNNLKVENNNPNLFQSDADELSIEKLKSIPGYNDLSDDSLEDIADGIKELALLLNMIQNVAKRI